MKIVTKFIEEHKTRKSIEFGPWRIFHENKKNTVSLFNPPHEPFRLRLLSFREAVVMNLYRY